MRDLVIIGAGGFGREVFDCANANGDAVMLLNDHRELRYENAFDAVVAIGKPETRKFVVDDIGATRGMERCGAKWDMLYHKSAQVLDSFPNIGKGIIMCANAIVSSGCKIGKHVQINFACTIGHDVIIGDFVTISPGVHISGNVTIGDEVFIGTGALIREKLTIGKGATIGMGAVVVKDVPAGMVVVGNPAKEMK